MKQPKGSKTPKKPIIVQDLKSLAQVMTPDMVAPSPKKTQKAEKPFTAGIHFYHGFISEERRDPKTGMLIHLTVVASSQGEVGSFLCMGKDLPKQFIATLFTPVKFRLKEVELKAPDRKVLNAWYLDEDVDQAQAAIYQRVKAVLEMLEADSQMEICQLSMLDVLKSTLAYMGPEKVGEDPAIILQNALADVGSFLAKGHGNRYYFLKSNENN